MTIDDFYAPIEPIIFFLRNYLIKLYGFEFTFMDMIIWFAIASVILWFIFQLIDN